MVFFICYNYKNILFKIKYQKTFEVMSVNVKLANEVFFWESLVKDRQTEFRVLIWVKDRQTEFENQGVNFGWMKDQQSEFGIQGVDLREWG